MSGYLELWRDKKWKRSWYVIKDMVLYTFGGCQDVAALETFPLLGYHVSKMSSPYKGQKHVFQLRHSGQGSTYFAVSVPSDPDYVNKYVAWLLVRRFD